MPEQTAQDLIKRSNKLGSNPRNTNYAGGNTSSKGHSVDPVTGENVELIWIKGSGGDLGTLTEQGLAVLRLDRARALQNVYPGVSREDEMVQAMDFCLHGKGGAAPSIDAAMHVLVEANHVDHLHPDSGIAIATAVNGEELTREIFGDKVVWVPWRRPGFQLGMDIAKIKRANPNAIGCILGGHGITAWGETSAQCERNSLAIIRGAETYVKTHGKKQPFGKQIPKFAPLAKSKRLDRAAALAPLLRGVASTDKPMIGHFDDSPAVLEFLGSSKLKSLAALGTSCPDHFLRTKVKPMVLDLEPGATWDKVVKRVAELHQEYRKDYSDYYKRFAKKDSPAMRGADPAIVLVPGIGMFSFGPNKQTARVAGEFYINAINVMRGAEAVSKYSPINDREKFRIEYWALEEAKLSRLPKPKPLASRVAFVTGGASGIGKAIVERVVAEGACVVIADMNIKAAEELAHQLGGPDVAIAVPVNVTSESDIMAALARANLAFGGVDLVVNNAGLSLSKPLLETTESDWDLQHDVMAKGSFLVSREAARILINQNMGGDIVYISSKNSVFAGPNNIAYSATKADQAHQVRLLAAELGPHGIRVNGINPDGVVRGSGIFSAGWGASRARVYGVKEEDLGAFYAKRTILGKEVLPENVANAVVALTAGDLSHTTGLHIPVDAGVAAAFLR
ncbi:MAG: bifunctional aldolase/short-chain dehydrogenase [Candidatus Nanopelagicales bacterium]